jgi:S-adenosylmethionine decarboxylase
MVYDGGKEPKDWGVTGGIYFAESHCSIYTFPEKNSFTTLDIYSCKAFDEQKILRVLQEFFKPAEYKHNIMLRGVGFPR